MIQSHVNNDRLFLTRLSETIKCHSGDNILLECYVRHQRIKSIAWYAKGERVDTRGVRIWHRYEPITGQCLLCIRSALSCDEGSYYCEAISFDNVIETLGIKLKVDSRSRGWTKIPVLHMVGHVIPGGIQQLTTGCGT